MNYLESFMVAMNATLSSTVCLISATLSSTACLNSFICAKRHQFQKKVNFDFSKLSLSGDIPDFLKSWLEQISFKKKYRK